MPAEIAVENGRSPEGARRAFNDHTTLPARKSERRSLAAAAKKHARNGPGTTGRADRHPPARPIGDSPRAAGVAGTILEQLASRIGVHKYDMWFGHTRLQVTGRRVEIAACNAYVAKWIDAHFAEDLHGVARAAIGREAEVEVRVAPELFGRDTGPGAGRPGSAGAGPRPPATDDGLSCREPHARGRGGGVSDRRRPRPRGPALRRLEEFVVGQSNRLAHSTALRLLEAEDASEVSPMFIHSECGLGKTHLLQGICRRYGAATGRTDTVRYVTGEQFTNEYIASLRGNTVEKFRRSIRKLELLAIDDVHFLSNKTHTQSEFLHTLNAIDLSGARVVLAADEHPRLIKRFSQALISRFLSGMVVRVDRPDRDTRIAIVRQLASARGVPMSDAAVEAVASRCVGSVRELEGALLKLTALWSLAAGELATGDNGTTAPGATAAGEIGLVLVEQVFKDHGWRPPVPIRIETVIATICERIGISRSDLMGVSRHRRVVLGRALVAYLGRAMTTLSYPEIARALGRPYHSTVHTAEQRLRRQLKGDELAQPGDGEKPLPLQELVDQLRHEITRSTARV